MDTSKSETEISDLSEEEFSDEEMIEEDESDFEDEILIG